MSGELHLGGDFLGTGNFVASWDGTTFSAVGSGVNAPVRALTVFNGALYAGGEFQNSGPKSTRRIAKWIPPNSIKEQDSAADNVVVFPNPFEHLIMIETLSKQRENIEIALFNILGERVLIIDQAEINGTYTKSVDLSQIPGGIYFLSVKTDSGLAVKKIVKN